jgi:hypothetical protein
MRWFAELVSLAWKRHNESLQVTFDSLPTFAFAKAAVALNGPELRR